MTQGGRPWRAPIAGALLVFGFGLFGLVSASECPAPRIDEQARIAYVLDGDTVALEDGRRIRLLGINAPEISHDDRPAEPYGEEARHAVVELLPRHQSVGLVYDVQRQDKYGRWLAHVYLADGANVQASLLERGLAATLVIPPNQAQYECYGAVEHRARQMNAGIWAIPEHQAVDSRHLAPDTRGYYMVEGRVRAGGTAPHGWWLKLDGGLTLYIKQEDQHYFADHAPLALVHHRIRVRGWVYEAWRGPELRLRHPAALEVLK